MADNGAPIELNRGQDVASADAEPQLGELTKAQQPQGGISAIFAQLEGFGQMPAAAFSLFRAMRNDPTIEIARRVAMSPLRAAEWSYQVPKGKEANDDRVDFIREAINPLRRGFMADVLRSLDYGWFTFEKVHKIDKRGNLTYEKFKPLLNDITMLQVNNETGSFTGIKQPSSELPKENVFLFTYDGEAGNLHGRSRMLNVRKAWLGHKKATQRLGEYLQLSAKPIPMIQYPIGQSRDETGSVDDNFENAQKVLNSISHGAGILMPAQFAPWAERFIQRGMDPTSLMAWQISFLETKSSRVKDFIEPMRHFERLELRGWLVPERTVTEGEHGTKAESATQADVAILISEELLQDIIDCVNLFMIDPLLVMNFGEDARGSIIVVTEPLVNEKKAFIREVIAKALASPIGPELFTSLIDDVALIEQSGLPQREESERKTLVDAELERQRLAAEQQAAELDDMRSKMAPPESEHEPSTSSEHEQT